MIFFISNIFLHFKLDYMKLDEAQQKLHATKNKCWLMWKTLIRKYLTT